MNILYIYGHKNITADWVPTGCMGANPAAGWGQLNKEIGLFSFPLTPREIIWPHERLGFPVPRQPVHSPHPGQHHLSSIIYHLSSIIYHLSFIIYHLASSIYHLSI